ncbi:MAG: hypothetical protein GVY32_11980 [Gammaproteobacteria bacterium]|jgi:hypothetical protein|nr:hypothetical protein [Gammaproteobacteria bacterium]
MDRWTIALKSMLILAAAGLSGGCATHYYSQSDGVHYESPYGYQARVAYVDPLVYPYWSLDYFYFSRHYHPYSVVVHRYDPWYYPYPGWYYGYRVGLRHRYPWYGHGGYYSHYQPWRFGGWYAFGRYDHDRWPRVRQIDSRLAELETRRSLAVRAQRPDRTTMLVPAVSQSLPATSRRAMLRASEVDRGRRGAILRGGSAGPARADVRNESRRSRVIERLRSRPPEARNPATRMPPRAPVDVRRRAPLRESEAGPSRRPIAPPRSGVSPRRGSPAPVERQSRPTVQPDHSASRRAPAPPSRPSAPTRSRSASDRSGGEGRRERR